MKLISFRCWTLSLAPQKNFTTCRSCPLTFVCQLTHAMNSAAVWLSTFLPHSLCPLGSLITQERKTKEIPSQLPLLCWYTHKYPTKAFITHFKVIRFHFVICSGNKFASPKLKIRFSSVQNEENGNETRLAWSAFLGRMELAWIRLNHKYYIVNKRTESA